ncbi:MAG UNVERIFIED_CONTAM: hypothetical protein LVR18_48625 [Planctomycetaceae bacterium]
MFPSADEVLQVRGSVSLGISDFVDASATIIVENNVRGPDASDRAGRGRYRLPWHRGLSTATTSDDTGVRLSNGALDLRWTKNTATDESWYALGGVEVHRWLGLPT